jgi:hypothetical protein
VGTRDYAWKTNGCNGVSVFLAGDGRTAPGAGAGRKACPTPAHSGCRPYRYLHPGCRPYHYSQASPVGDATPATSPCGGVNVGRSRTHGAEEDTGSDKRLTSSVRLLSNFIAERQLRQLRDVGRDPHRALVGGIADRPVAPDRARGPRRRGLASGASNVRFSLLW